MNCTVESCVNVREAVTCLSHPLFSPPHSSMCSYLCVAYVFLLSVLPLSYLCCTGASWEALPLSQLFWTCSTERYWNLNLKYKPSYWFTQIHWPGLRRFISSSRQPEVPSLHGDLSDQREGQSRHPEGLHRAQRRGQQQQWMRSSQWSSPTFNRESDTRSDELLNLNVQI